MIGEQLLGRLSCAVFAHAGELWAIDEAAHLVFVLPKRPPISSADLLEAPDEIVTQLGKCPGPTMAAPLERRSARSYAVAGIEVPLADVVLICALHPGCEWRATFWWEPVYAVKDDRVRAMVMPIVVAEGGAPS